MPFDAFSSVYEISSFCLKDKQTPVSSDKKEQSPNEQVTEDRVETASAEERPSIEAIEVCKISIYDLFL